MAEQGNAAKGQIMVSTGFPDYKKPPVVEVAIAVQFAPLRGFTAAHAGLYWHKIRAEFGQAEEQAPIPPMSEPASPEEVEPASVFTFGKPPMPRLWFIDSTSTRIIQVQHDKFIHNWRKMNPGDKYPRFDEIRENFLKYWAGFIEFLEKNRLPKPDINQCELTYVNRMKKSEGWNSMPDLENMFTTFVWKTRSGFLPPPDNVQWGLHFSLPEKWGRLHVQMVPVRLPPENEQAIHLVLTARGRPEGTIDLKAMNKWFDLGHEWIVKGFADIVDKKTDSLWEKQA